jgi:C4-dicarboxylate transporter
MDARHGFAVLLNPFCPFSTAKVLALKATVLLLLTMLIKARVQIAAGSALGIALLLLQTLVFLAVSGGVLLAAGGAALYATQQRRPAAA